MLATFSLADNYIYLSLHLHSLFLLLRPGLSHNTYPSGHTTHWHALPVWSKPDLPGTDSVITDSVTTTSSYAKPSLR
jgi:hypothetical protein